MDQLKEAVERVEMGWDRDKARATLADSMQTIEVASRMAKRAIVGIEGATETLEYELKELREFIESIRLDGISKRGGNTLTRLQASKIIQNTDRIARTFDIAPIIRMSLDLTNQTHAFVNMMDKIDKRYGEEDRRASEDITRHLTEDQLMQVYEWVRENKATLS